MTDYRLRPHHALCLQFFVGKGYSEGFVRNMQERKQLLEGSDPEVRTVCGCDIICSCCVHAASGSCESSDKVAGFDRKVLLLTGLSEGEPIRFSKLTELAREKIIRAGKLGEVCGSCQWWQLCSSMLKNIL